jgi:hypothetical protein
VNSPGKIWKAPGGKPAASIRYPTASVPSGDFSEGLMIEVFPQAKAGAAFQARKCNDPFQAVIPAHTPKGS